MLRSLPFVLVAGCSTARGSSVATPRVETSPGPSVEATTLELGSDDASSGSIATNARDDSPFEGTHLGSVEPDLLAFNEWATRRGLRDKIAQWVSVGLPLQSDVETHLDVTYEGRESPTVAHVIVVQDRYLDDSVRGEKFVFRFSRKPCVSCRDPSQGWWVESLQVTHRCWEGRGHQDFSKEPCR